MVSRFRGIAFICVFHEHCAGHGTDTAGYGRYVCSLFTASFEIDIAAELSVNAIHADIDDAYHPTPAGTYLAALLFTNAVAGVDISALSDIDALAANDCARLRYIASALCR